MITVMNRKELIATYDMRVQSEVRDLLAHNHIDYQVKVVNRKSSSPIGPGMRAYTGTMGEKLDMEGEYIIYVKKDEYDAAWEVIKDVDVSPRR
ncbi:hypothetical protein HGO97_017550 [Faecalicatena sp. AGMB00832]|uniref:Signal transducing protein n=1 Tax=Faecalicatena faecalis TaxID=2726362 RepID=A0ABS6D844_9FIRM|nr:MULTISPECIES: hypothetical protein [Faecalicatena]MBU3877611.1 hypothetical protein [Faecalicatena faecalis]MCI6463918.1 hypothetical protein [Faecalicatena sp.]MDY5620818.1 hypothetical protein [Lachnospiraceae bacterium]